MTATAIPTGLATELHWISDALPPDAGPAAFPIPEGLSYDQWRRLGFALVRVHRAVQWWIGDWLIYGEHHYGEKFAQAAAETGLSPESLKRFQWVCSRFPVERRRPALSFSHHEAVAARAPAEADTLLERAETENVSSRDFRAEVRPPAVSPRPPGVEAARGRLRAPTPRSGGPMPTPPPTRGLPEPRPGLVSFSAAVEWALQQQPSTKPRYDSELLDDLHEYTDRMDEALRDRASRPTAKERLELAGLAARLTAAAFLLAERERLEFPGAADLTADAEAGAEGDDDDFPDRPDRRARGGEEEDDELPY